MASGKSDYLENKVADLLLGATAYTIPGTVYVALYTAAPTDAGGGTEVTGNAYARVAVTNDKTTGWNAASGGLVDNKNAINFATPTPSGWGTVVAVGIFDASTAGNLLFWGDLTASKTINASDTVSFAAGALDVTED